MNVKAVISGSDGTLVDSLYMIRRGQYEAAIEYFVERGIARHGLPTYKEYEQLVNQSVGGSSRETMERTLRLLFAKHEKQLEQIDFDDLERRLGPIQDRLAPLHLHPFFDLSGFLRWLGQQKIGLGIFTSSTRHQLIRNWGSALPALGYSQLFSQVGVAEEEKIIALVSRIKATFGLDNFYIVTSDDVAATKPDPEGIKKVLKNLNLKAEDAVMVGDLPADIIAGKKAGVRTIGIGHGFGTAEELEAVGADKVVGSLAELRAYIENL
ncbi:MAG: HAD family hydrolase [Candidatus Saccharimonadales bacterium]